MFQLNKFQATIDVRMDHVTYEMPYSGADEHQWLPVVSVFYNHGVLTCNYNHLGISNFTYHLLQLDLFDVGLTQNHETPAQEITSK